MKYCIDIDGTICNDAKGAYNFAIPYLKRIKKINKLYDDGHDIIYFTARGGTTGINWREITEKQLKKWGCKFNELRMGKPDVDIFVDDKTIITDEFFKKSKYAIVTGGLGDIGCAVTDALTEIGYTVRLIDLKNDSDITKFEEMVKIFNETKSIDVLVNCAGITKGSFEEIIDVNLKAPYELSNLAFKKMKKNGGCIINITSLWSEVGFTGNPIYGASKGGLKQLTRALAIDWAKYGIRVNNIGLGYFKTNMTAYSWKHRRQQVTDKIPLGRWGKPEDVREAVKFLVNSDYVTGQDIYIDGGWLANGGL